MTRRRRHPADVTAQRLSEALDRWSEKFTPLERDEISRVIWALDQIADGDR